MPAVLCELRGWSPGGGQGSESRPASPRPAPDPLLHPLARPPTRPTPPPHPSSPWPQELRSLGTEDFLEVLEKYPKTLESIEALSKARQTTNKRVRQKQADQEERRSRRLAGTMLGSNKIQNIKDSNSLLDRLGSLEQEKLHQVIAPHQEKLQQVIAPRNSSQLPALPEPGASSQAVAPATAADAELMKRVETIEKAVLSIQALLEKK